MDPVQKPILDSFLKRPTAQSRKATSSLLITRPIATNSRVKQDEQYRKDMYLAFVNNALQQKANVRFFLKNTWRAHDLLMSRIQGNSEPFDELVNQFNPKRTPSDGAPRTAQIRLWILALSHVVSRLERTHFALVDAIIGMPWTTLDVATVKSYTVFIGMLLSARPEYLSLILGKISQGFTHRTPPSF